MNKIEEAPHIRSLFRQLDDAGKMRLVARLRDIAIRALHPVIAKHPQRVFSEAVTKAYLAKGISLEWNLTIPSQASAFYFGSLNSGLTPSQKSAATLLYGCTTALEESAVSDRVAQIILDAYAGLDLDTLAKGQSFTGQSRGPDALGVLLLEILKRRGKRTSSSAVWGELRGMAALPDSGIIQKITGDYVYWRNAEGSVKKTSAATVDNRLSRIRQSI